MEGEGPMAVKDTVPVGWVVPANAGVTVARKATCWLTAEGFGVDATLVVVAVLLTTSFTALEAGLVLKFVFEVVNVAVIVCVAGGPGNVYVHAGTIPADVKVVVHRFPLTLSV
jgi:hypothetical protein